MNIKANSNVCTYMYIICMSVDVAKATCPSPPHIPDIVPTDFFLLLEPKSQGGVSKGLPEISRGLRKVRRVVYGENVNNSRLT